jgi:hypothetical protein
LQRGIGHTCGLLFTKGLQACSRLLQRSCAGDIRSSTPCSHGCSTACMVDETYYRALSAVTSQHSHCPRVLAVKATTSAFLAYIHLTTEQQLELSQFNNEVIDPLPVASLTLNNGRHGRFSEHAYLRIVCPPWLPQLHLCLSSNTAQVTNRSARQRRPGTNLRVSHAAQLLHAAFSAWQEKSLQSSRRAGQAVLLPMRQGGNVAQNLLQMWTRVVRIRRSLCQHQRVYRVQRLQLLTRGHVLAKHSLGQAPGSGLLHGMPDIDQTAAHRLGHPHLCQMQVAKYCEHRSYSIAEV